MEWTNAAAEHAGQVRFPSQSLSDAPDHAHKHTLFYNELWWVAEDAHWGRWDVSFASTASIYS